MLDLFLLLSHRCLQVREVPFLRGALAEKFHGDCIFAVFALKEERKLLSLILELLDAFFAEGETRVTGIDFIRFADCA